MSLTCIAPTQARVSPIPCPRAKWARRAATRATPTATSSAKPSSPSAPGNKASTSIPNGTIGSWPSANTTAATPFSWIIPSCTTARLITSTPPMRPDLTAPIARVFISFKTPTKTERASPPLGSTGNSRSSTWILTTSCMPGRRTSAPPLHQRPLFVRRFPWPPAV